MGKNLQQEIITTEDKRKQKIAQLKAQIQKEEALLNKAKRKERNGHLIAFGVLIEELFKHENSTAGRQNLVDMAKKYLKDKTLLQALAGFDRLNEKRLLSKNT